MSQVAHQAGAYPGFCSRKRIGVFLLLPDGMVAHHRAIPSMKFVGYPFAQLKGERHCDSKVSCPRTQYNG